MRALLVALVICAGVAATATARAKPMRRPQCPGPTTWDAVTRCVGENYNAHRVVQLSPHVRAIVVTPEGQVGRVYVQVPAGGWEFERDYSPSLRVADDRDDNGGRRIELRQIFDFGERRQLRMKTAVLCAKTGGCNSLPYDCVELDRGRVVGVVKGAIEIDGLGVRVVADRSHAGEQCQL